MLALCWAFPLGPFGVVLGDVEVVDVGVVAVVELFIAVVFAGVVVVDGVGAAGRRLSAVVVVRRCRPPTGVEAVVVGIRRRSSSSSSRHPPFVFMRRGLGLSA